MSQFNSNTPPLPAEQSQSGGKGLAVSSLILGICGFIPLLGFLPAALGVILGGVSLVKHKAGRGLAIAGIVTGGVGLVLGPLIAFAILMPVLAQAKEEAKQAVCKSNLRQIGLAVLMSLEDNQKFPPDLQILVLKGYLESSALRCPGAEQSNGKGRESDYFYLPPSSADDNPKKILACDLKPNHKGWWKGWRNVLYFDYSVKFISGEDFRAELQLPHNLAFAEALRKKERSSD